MRDTFHVVAEPSLVRAVYLGVFSSVVSLACALQGRAEELRDPFTFSPRTEAVEHTGVVLVGVLWDTTNPLAIIGETPVGVGDSVAGWQMIEIQPNGVMVQRGERKQFIALGHTLPSD